MFTVNVSLAIETLYRLGQPVKRIFFKTTLDKLCNHFMSIYIFRTYVNIVIMTFTSSLKYNNNHTIGQQPKNIQVMQRIMIYNKQQKNTTEVYKTSIYKGIKK